MTKKEYNGWYNYETWLMNLWMDNDEGSQGYWSEIAQECYDDAEACATFTREENAVFAFADRLKEEKEQENPVEGANFWADMMNAALSEVNYHDIAEHYIDEVEKEEEEVEEVED